MYEDLNSALNAAFKSIKDFKEEINSDGIKKSGINFEKTLISNNLKNEFSEEEEEFLFKLIYPHKEKDYYVDDAFAIFIGYEIKIEDKDRFLKNSEFRDLIENKIKSQIDEIIGKIKESIISTNLIGHDFYVYILPFTEIQENGKKILERL